MILSSGLLDDPQFSRLKGFLIDATGMVFYADKDVDLARVVSERLTATGIGACGQYLELLQDELRGKAEVEAAIAEMTIGETYFFRHREQFDVLRETIFPEIIARNHETRRLRIWSAGCATGPEPYSIAILLRQHFATAIAGWNVSVLGTDINQKFLARARTGSYDEWAFRSVPEEIKRNCFDRDGKHWVIRPEFREVVTFQYHNLITNAFPSIINSISAFDLIICRNVIIYFSQEMVRSLVPRFRDTLVDGGWLIMGHAESNIELFRDFRTVNAPGAVVYQKLDSDEIEALERQRRPASAAIVSRPFPPPAAPPPSRPLKPVPPRSAFAPAPAPAPVAAPPPVAAHGALGGLKALADSGQWEKAERLCCRMLEEQPLNPMLHYYYGLVLEQMGRIGDAENSLRRAIYLDRSFILPHYHMGLLALRQGDRAKALKALRNASALVDRLADGEVLAEADGLTASQLKEMVAIHLDILGAA